MISKNNISIGVPEQEGQEEREESDAKVNHLLGKKDLYPSGTVHTITSPIENILVSLYNPHSQAT